MQTKSPKFLSTGRLSKIFMVLGASLLIVVFALGLIPPSTVQALGAGDVTLVWGTPFAALDSNKPCTTGPQAMYIQIDITNPLGGTGTLYGVSMTLSGFNNGFALDTGESATRYIGTILDGATKHIWYFVTYPCDPIGLSTNITATVSDSGAGSIAFGPYSLTTRSEISAQAGGQVISQIIGGVGTFIGQVVPMTVVYSFGNVGSNQDVIIQPAGNPSFESGCLRLVGVDVTAVPPSTKWAGITTSSDNLLYFTGVTSSATGNEMTVVYYFMYQCIGVASLAQPYADLGSGTQYKYTGNYGVCEVGPCSFDPPSNEFTITKSVTPTTLPTTGGTVTYTVVITNTSLDNGYINQITDVLPPGVTYVDMTLDSQVLASNSSLVPTTGSIGTINWMGNPITSCTPSPTICDGTWLVPASGTLTLKYTATVQGVAGSYTNSVTAYAGTTMLGPVTATVVVPAPEGHIIVDKVTVPSGDPTSFSFNTTGAGYTPFALTDAALPNDQTLQPGTYSVSEVVPAGWNLDSATCVSSNPTNAEIPSNIQLDPGETVTCTFTNTKLGSIIVEKQTVPDGAVGNFSFAGDAAGTISDGGQIVVSNLLPGIYTSTEANPAPAFALTSIVCDDNNSTGDVSTRIATFHVEAGEVVKCTFTNTLQPGTLIVKKVIINDNGGTKVFGDFTFVVDGGNPVQFDPIDGQNELSVPAGTYNVTEPAVAGYTTTYNNCSNIVVPPGGSATCTVTNNDQPATLTVIKVVINDDGGTKTFTDFSFVVNGGAPVAFEVDGQNDLTVPAGTYNIIEPAVAGYTTTYNNCTDVVIPNGGTQTCTITNNDQPATLTVVKVVINDDGGTKTFTDFSFVVNTTAPVAFEPDGQNDLTVPAGTYNITEPAVAGYTTTYNNCSGVVIPNGGTQTCTITNNDQPATLTVIKVVINDDGGTKTFTDFSFVVNGGAPIAFEADGQNDLSVPAGTYDITEPAVAGYTTTYSNCSQVAIPNGGTATCTITNNDQPATLTVIKVVVNDDGGTKTFTDFSFVVNGGAPVTFEADGQNDLSVPAGTYNITEPAVAGYTTTYNNCSNVIIPNGGTQTCTITNNDQPATLTVIKVVINNDGGTKTFTDFSFVVNGGAPIAFEADGQNDLSVPAGTYSVTEPSVAGYTTTYNNCTEVVIPNGGSATCTITNDDQPAVLIVKKVVINDDGGTKTFTDFSFVVNGGAPVIFEADGQNDLAVNPGTFTITEPAVAGYTTTYDNCTDVVIPLGGTQTCTITNNDQPATLIVRKVVINDDGGTKTFIDFSFVVNTTAPVAFEPDGQNDLTVPAGTYNITEPAVAGYTTTYDNCSNVVIPNGGTQTCTITNNDQPATLIVVKVVINDNGGTKTFTDFSFVVNGGPAPVAFEPDGQNNLTVPAGTYNVTEPAVAGYTTTYSNCTDVVIPNGGTATCTITNNDQAATLIVQKVVINDDGGTKVFTDFTFVVNGGAPVTFEADGQNDLSVPAGTYNITEPAVAGYTTTYNNCTDVVIPLGGTQTCTITNNDQPATLTVIKVVINDNGGTKIFTDFTFSVNGAAAVAFEADGQNDMTVPAGTYSVTEPAVAGYSTTYNNCSQVVIPNGGSATCTITNNDQASTLIVRKVVINDNGGTKTFTDFTFVVNGGAPVTFEADGQNDLAVNPGTYTVTEPAVVGYATTYDNCTDVVIPLGGTQTCTITNDDQVGTIVVKKVMLGGTGTFTFTGSPAGTINANEGTIQMNVSPGTYTSVETLQTGWDLTSITCDDTNSTGDVATATATFVVAASETVVCTFTNTLQAPQIDITKSVASIATVSTGTYNVTFSLVVKNTGNVPLANVQVTDNLNLTFPLPTTYSVVSINSATLSVNPLYNGNSNINMLVGSDTMAVGQEGTITLVVQVVPTIPGPFLNLAIVTGMAPDESTVTDQDDAIVTFVLAFNPPVGIKLVDGTDAPVLKWSVSWINSTNLVPVVAFMSDPIPDGTLFSAVGAASGYPVPVTAPLGSTNLGVACMDASLITSTTLCYYEGPTPAFPRGRVIWSGILGPDFGATDVSMALHEITISFNVVLDEGVLSAYNYAKLNSDLNGDGDALDPNEQEVAFADNRWTVTIPETGFAPGKVTELSAQAAEQSYQSLGNLWLEIPRLGIQTNIMGVPVSGTSWDVSWLGRKAGWLNGTAYPSTEGNSVITGHVYLPNGKPGPFVNMRQLKWGDQVIVHMDGQQYTYEVRDVSRVRPDDLSPLRHEDRSWVTLITCQGYNESNNTYAYRLIARAVLVSVQAEAKDPLNTR